MLVRDRSMWKRSTLTKSKRSWKPPNKRQKERWPAQRDKWVRDFAELHHLSPAQQDSIHKLVLDELDGMMDILHGRESQDDLARAGALGLGDGVDGNWGRSDGSPADLLSVALFGLTLFIMKSARRRA